MAYRRLDMIFNDYSWSLDKKPAIPKKITPKDKTILNRNDGHELLHFINSLGKTWGIKSDDLGSYQNFERILRVRVPRRLRTYSELRDWIWNNFPRL